MKDEWNGKSNGERNERPNDESNDQRKMLTYRILRYVPNLMRDEWMNIGVLLEDGPSGQRAIKLIEEDSEFGGVREMSRPSFENRTRPGRPPSRNSTRRCRTRCNSAR